MKRWCLLGSMSLFLTVAACDAEDTPEAASEETYRIQTEVVATERLATEIITSAALEAADWQPLYFGGGGRVASVKVRENHSVSRGELLAELDDDGQRLQIEKASLALEQSKLNEEQARHKLEQTQALVETGGASPEDVYDKEQRLLEAQNAVRQSELNLATQRVKLEGMQLIAPFEGMISEVNIRVGDLVRGDVSDPDRAHNLRPPMVIVRPGTGMVLRAQLPEGRAADLAVGTPARIVLMEHRDITLEGTVRDVARTVDRDTRTVHVEVELKVPDGGFPAEVRDGATVLVTFLADIREGAITVSERAMFYLQNNAYVFVVKEDNRVERVLVEKGVMRNGRVEIVSGLQPGQRVACSHLYLLRDGQLVTAQDEQP